MNLSLRNLLSILTLVGALLLTTGCSLPPLHEDFSGTVVSKDHTEASTKIVPTKCGKISCSLPRKTPEKWTLTVQNAADAQRLVTVDERTFDSVNVGDPYTDES